MSRTSGIRASVVERLRPAIPSRTQIIEYSPALLMAGWMLLAWEEKSLWWFVVAIFAGFASQAFLMLGLLISYAAAAHWLREDAPNSESFILRNPTVLGPLLLVVALWMYDGYTDKQRERALVDCLEGRATMTRIRQEQGLPDRGWGDEISLERGGMSWAVKSCLEEDAESRAGSAEE